jgi:hypothetical protein
LDLAALSAAFSSLLWQVCSHPHRGDLVCHNSTVSVPVLDRPAGPYRPLARSIGLLLPSIAASRMTAVHSSRQEPASPEWRRGGGEATWDPHRQRFRDDPERIGGRRRHVLISAAIFTGSFDRA